MAKERYSETEDIGVSAVYACVARDLKWIFRAQHGADVGIDAHIERVEDDGTPSGQLLAAQIKSGKGNFHETKDAYVYYINEAHYDYWMKHSLPVILVGHIPDSNETLWVAVNESTVKETPKGWKVSLPKTATLNSDSRRELTRLFDGTPRAQRLRVLGLHEPLMREVASGRKVSVEIDDWYNKSLKRSGIKVFVHDDKGNESIAMEWFTHWVGMSIPEVIAQSFPWADASIDADFYDINNEVELSWEDKRSIATDIDNGFATAPGWNDGADDWRPYADSGETETYRVELTLNELGDGYLKVAGYLDAKE